MKAIEFTKYILSKNFELFKENGEIKLYLSQNKGYRQPRTLESIYKTWLNKQNKSHGKNSSKS